ncbi:myelin-associated glycoprotein-like isoform X1 [Solea senegalensis]|uniref:Myelin-associated glycoprotein-like isoform X1 n=2 Tax=Solea senegalensis TaxID=28829 RepID=A0AAV6T156_SOLSE|nr:myelin-associated glycoprotein isoform X2 [Solea senegalensis]KAG7523110.1 myelin-associated glycoprotein-like isoform X1 [Solea senegalensis]
MSTVKCAQTAHHHLTAAMGVVLTDFVLLMALMKGVVGQRWNIMLPETIVGLTKSCITIPCHFTIPADQETNILNCSNHGVWRKGSLTGLIVINSQKPNIIQGQIIGDLTQKNCTTVMENFSEDDNDMFFFRLECPNLKFTFTNGVRITAKTDPSPPQMTSVTQMPQGAEVKLQCSAPLTCSNLPPSISWQPQDIFSQEELVVQVADGQTVMTSTMTFTASADLHNKSIICSVSYPLSKGQRSSLSATTQRLNIQYGPRSTTAKLSTSGPVSDGTFVTFTCSSDANPPVRSYTWFRDNRGQLIRVGQGQTLILQVSKRDTGLYLCETQTQRSSQRSRSVVLEVRGSATQGIEQENCNNVNSLIIPYIICGVLLVLFILTIAVDLYKHQSLSKRLKKIEQNGDHTYAELRTVNVNSDYDQLQRRPQLKPKPRAPENSEYENSTSRVTVRESQPNRD